MFLFFTPFGVEVRFLVLHWLSSRFPDVATTLRSQLEADAGFGTKRDWMLNERPRTYEDLVLLSAAHYTVHAHLMLWLWSGVGVCGVVLLVLLYLHPATRVFVVVVLGAITAIFRDPSHANEADPTLWEEREGSGFISNFSPKNPDVSET